MRVCGFFLLTSSTGCLRPPSEDEQPINTSPPEGGEHGPQLRPSFGGLRGLRPCLFPTPTSGAGPLQAMPAASWSRLWRSLRPCGREIPAYQGAQVAAVWVGTSRPASWACRGATAAGNAMAKQGARVARRRDCAAFGYVVTFAHHGLRVWGAAPCQHMMRQCQPYLARLSRHLTQGMAMLAEHSADHSNTASLAS